MQGRIQDKKGGGAQHFSDRHAPASKVAQVPKKKLMSGGGGGGGIRHI